MLLLIQKPVNLRYAKQNTKKSRIRPGLYALLNESKFCQEQSGKKTRPHHSKNIYIIFKKQKNFSLLVKLKLIKDEKQMIISSPTNFEHTLHVYLNPATGEFIVWINFLHVIY